MPLEDHNIIEQWTEDNLFELPTGETDDYEFKSSLIRESASYRSELQDKIQKAASAFWNTGGGILLVGLDDNGQIDGGIPEMMGKQKLRDWVDVIVSGVTPIGPYTVRTIKREQATSSIEIDCCVLVVAFGESFDLPHMAPDHRYYVRAGAHSNPASHYLVEAIRARRGLRRPLLRAMLRENPQKIGIIELVVLTVNDLPALNVLVNFEPVPTHLKEQFPERLPLIVPIIDRTNPFRIDIATYHRLTHWLGEEPFYVTLGYEGVRGTRYEDRQLVDHLRSLSSSELRLSDGNAPEKMMKKIYKQFARLNNNLESFLHIAPDENKS